MVQRHPYRCILPLMSTLDPTSSRLTRGVDERPHLAARMVLRMRRILLACLGVLCVGLAAVGVVVPGLPTTIFLILATVCFMRSCPWLQRTLVETRLFGPFLKYLEPGAEMPIRAKVISLVAMWVAISTSLVLLSTADAPIVWVAPTMVIAGAIGTVSIVRIGPSAGCSETA